MRRYEQIVDGLVKSADEFAQKVEDTCVDYKIK